MRRRTDYRAFGFIATPWIAQSSFTSVRKKINDSSLPEPCDRTISILFSGTEPKKSSSHNTNRTQVIVLAQSEYISKNFRKQVIRTVATGRLVLPHLNTVQLRNSVYFIRVLRKNIRRPVQYEFRRDRPAVFPRVFEYASDDDDGHHCRFDGVYDPVSISPPPSRTVAEARKLCFSHKEITYGWTRPAGLTTTAVNALKHKCDDSGDRSKKCLT